MQKLATNHQNADSYSQPHYRYPQYSSVEIPNAHTRFCYHFKIWRLDKREMVILVKEDSKILPELKEGDCLSMKFYGSEALADTESRETEIQMIRKAENGRFKGHYLVYLDILN